MKKTLSLKDFTSIMNEKITHKAVFFQEYINQMNRFSHNTYFMEAETNTGSSMRVIHPYSKEVIDVTSYVSNDYLGLSRRPETIEAGIEAIKKYGTGSCASSMIGGYLNIHKELESKLAKFFEKDNAVIFPSGFGANEGVLKAILGKNDIALTDTHIHTSARNGLSETNTKNIGHNDIEYLEKVLIDVKEKYTTKLVIVDGVYSQDGDLANIPEISRVCRKHDALLMVDDAHGIGVFGEYGRGVIEHFNMLDYVDIITGTLSKSIGCVGGFVVSTEKIIQYIRYYAPHNIFSVALPPSIAASALKALEIIQTEKNLRTQMWDNIKLMRTEMHRIGADITPTQSQIFPVKVRDNNETRNISAQLLERGIYASAITFPAVREKDSRIRISLLATHKKNDIFALAEAFKELLKL